jgi:hypothetical protein
MTEVVTFIDISKPDLTINKIYQFSSTPFRNIQQNTSPNGRLFAQKSYMKNMISVKFGWLEADEKKAILDRIVDKEFKLRFFNEESQQHEEGTFMLLNGRYDSGTMKDVSYGVVWIDFGFSAVETTGRVI